MTASAIVSLLIEVSWRAVVVAALVGGSLAAWRVRTGAARHAAWVSVVLVMLTMPAWLRIVPTWTMSLPAVVEQADFSWADITLAGDAVPAEPRSTSQGGEMVPAAGAVVAGSAEQAPVPRAVTPARWMGWLSLSLIAVVVWLAGVALQLVQLAGGWRVARRLERTCRVSVVDPRVWESHAVATPCAIGFRQPRIIVPASWALWSVEQRASVIRHEQAHITRHDLWFALLTRINRAVFWFHPLAWWLDRRVTSASEQACDDEVLRAGHNPQQYAELVLDVAAALRAQRLRVAWSQVQMAGGRQLGDRLDLILAGGVPRVGRARAAGVILMAALLCAGAVACQTTAAAPLEPDPAVTAELEREADRVRRWDALRNLTVEKARELDAEFDADPDNYGVAESLLWFYRLRGPELMGWDAAVDARRHVLLTVVERHPEWPLAQFAFEPQQDPAYYREARSLWEMHVASATADARAVANAVHFFRAIDPERAITLIQAAIPRFPATVFGASDSIAIVWRQTLGQIYADLASGADVPAPRARLAREALATSTDAAVLAHTAGQLLLRLRSENARHAADLDVRALSDQALTRAQDLAPEDPVVKYWLATRAQWDAVNAAQERLRTAFGTSIADTTLAQVQTLSVEDQLLVLPYLANRVYQAAELAGYNKKDDAARAKGINEAKAIADQAISLLESRGARSNAQSRRALAGVLLVRGAAAWAQGDRARTLAVLDDAATVIAAGLDVPLEGSPALNNLTNALIGAGEIDAVASYYERVAPHAGQSRARYEEIAGALRAGRMPRMYQRLQANAQARPPA
jgi:beta-lactamase regulating signal transducer with metallopeptidase domain